MITTKEQLIALGEISSKESLHVGADETGVTISNGTDSIKLTKIQAELIMPSAAKNEQVFITLKLPVSSLKVTGYNETYKRDFVIQSVCPECGEPNYENQHKMECRGLNSFVLSIAVTLRVLLDGVAKALGYIEKATWSYDYNTLNKSVVDYSRVDRFATPTSELDKIVRK